MSPRSFSMHIIHSIFASFLILTPGVVIHLLCLIKWELLLFFFLFLNLPGSWKPHFQWAWESCGSWWDGGFIPMVFLVVSMLCSGTVEPYYGHLIIVVQQKLSQSISTAFHTANSLIMLESCRPWVARFKGIYCCFHVDYSGAPLIQSPIGYKYLAAWMGWLY